MPRRTAPDARSGTFTLADVIRTQDLCWGADQAISLSAIAERRNVSRRQVEEAAQSLALTEYTPLIAGPRGIYLEADPDAVLAYAAALESRLASQYARIKALRKCAERMRTEPKQQPLWREAA